MSVKADSVTRFAKDAIQMEFRGKVFEGQGIQTAEVRVDDRGVIRVWIEVPEHWTTCHAISERNQRAIRRAAQK